jgi:hypothetical protein
MYKKGGSAVMLSGLEIWDWDGMISSTQNIDNEIEVLRSKDYRQRGGLRFGTLYFLYRQWMNFLQNLYKTSPVQVSLTPQEADLLEEPKI